MNLQQAIHWLEQGKGARVLRTTALLLGLLGLAVLVAYKQFHGPRTEETLRQADLGRSIASGQGFSTSVNYPQVHATWKNADEFSMRRNDFQSCIKRPVMPW